MTKNMQPQAHERQEKWNRRWMELAYAVSGWSKHPTIRVGCVIVDDEHNQLSGGYNGLPRGVDDGPILNQNDKKASITVHAEANAVAAAARNGHSLKGSTAYISAPPCAQCAALLIQAGVKRVVFDGNAEPTERWKASCEAALALLAEVNVEVKIEL